MKKTQLIAILTALSLVLILTAYILFSNDNKQGIEPVELNTNKTSSFSDSALKVTESSSNLQFEEETIEDVKNDIRATESYKNAKNVTYEELYRNIEEYTGEFVKLSGEVIQVQGERENWVMRVDVTKDVISEDFVVYDDTVYVVSASSNRVLEKDIIAFTGYVEGLHTYESVLGADITLPKLTIFEEEVIGRND